jgi:hypothetical protein
VPGTGDCIILSLSTSLDILTNPNGELTANTEVSNADKLCTDVDLSGLIFNESVGIPIVGSNILKVIEVGKMPILTSPSILE